MSDSTATWDACAAALAELGEAHEDVVTLEAGADAAVVATARDLALAGKVPYIAADAGFAGRAYGWIRDEIATAGLRARICVAAPAGDDVPRQPTEDIALMRAMPGMGVVVPADCNQAYRAMLESYERFEGPLYLRFDQFPASTVYPDLPAGLGDGVDIVREGSDLTIFACGRQVGRVLQAASLLSADDGVEAEVVNISILQPLAVEAVAGSLVKTGLALSVEEDPVAGGLADAVRAVAAERHPVPIFALGGAGEAELLARAREALLLKPSVSRPPIHGFTSIR